MAANNEKRAQRISTIKKIAGGIGKFCVSAFFSAISAKLVENAGGSKIEKYAAMGGGLLVGSMIGDQVSEYLDKSIDEFAGEFEDIEKQIAGETAEEE